MKAVDLLDAPSAQLVGFDWLVEALEPVSPYGARLFSEIRPFRAGEENAAAKRAARIARLAGDMPSEGLAATRASLARLPDVAPILARAALGEVLDDPDFLELLRVCDLLEEIETGNDATRAVSFALAAGKSERAGFYLADAFDAALQRARSAFEAAQAELDAARGRERERVAAQLGREPISGDEFLVMRADLRASLPAGVRVVREAPAYLLCAMEYDEPALAALQRRDAAAEAVARLEERVRGRLSVEVARHASGLATATAAAGEKDVLLAAARFAQRYRCVAPEIIDEPRVGFEGARFLPLEAELERAGRRFVPIDLDLRGAAVLTGPNMGGKSVCLQTCGFLALCAVFGLPVPAAAACVGLFERIAWLGLGRDERAGGLLSSFAQEIVALKETLSQDTPRLLMLADEFARATTPQEGKALSIALLERLSEARACALVATHLQGIAAAARVPHFAVAGLRRIPARGTAVDLREALEQLAEAMDYRIVEVSGDGRLWADAIALAELLGMDAAFIEAAQRALSQ